MTRARLVVLAASVALLATPLSWAKSSGFSSSSSSSSSKSSSSSASSSSRSSGFGSSSSYSSSRSSGSSDSSSSSSSRSRPSGFSSGDSDAPSRSGSTGFGSKLYTSQASKSAAATYSNNTAKTDTGGTTRDTGYTAKNAPAADNTSSSYAATPSYQRQAPPPTVAARNKSGIALGTAAVAGGAAAGYTMSRPTDADAATGARQSVSVQSGDPLSENTQALNGATGQVSHQPQSVDSAQPAESAAVANDKPEESSGRFWNILGIIVGLLSFGWAVRRDHKLKAKRKFASAPKTNYRL